MTDSWCTQNHNGIGDTFSKCHSETTNYQLHINEDDIKNNVILFNNKRSAVSEFYNNGVIFITGGTGFIGKALTEKLLRTCENIFTIYLLIRPKRGLSIECRWKQLLDSSVFDRIRSEGNSENLLSKIICIPGDITEPNLGLSDEHLKTVIDDVTVVFHSAATVKFNESFEMAAKLNTIGTHRVVLLCQKMKKLKSLIYVSTAYSNVDKKEIQEIVYPIPVHINNDIFDDVLSAELLERIGKKMEQRHPNTYTVTKAMAEWVVAEFAKNIPTAIVRPSIVTAAWQEPVAGWIASTGGVTGMILGSACIGMIRSSRCEKNFVADIIPVDLVVNTLIASAWHVSVFRSDEVKVFNCTSGRLNPLTWRKLVALALHNAKAMPSKYLKWYPGYTFRTNVFIQTVYEWLFQLLPALLVDTYFRLTGSQPTMMKINNQFKKMARSSEYFALRQWNFASENIRALQESMPSPSDRKLFNVDITSLNWETYVKNYVLGIRKYILKDSIDSLPSAQHKLKRLYWAHRIVQVSIITTFLMLAFKVVRLCFNLFK